MTTPRLLTCPHPHGPPHTQSRFRDWPSRSAVPRMPACPRATPGKTRGPGLPSPSQVSNSRGWPLRRQDFRPTTPLPPSTPPPRKQAHHRRSPISRLDDPSISPGRTTPQEALAISAHFRDRQRLVSCDSDQLITDILPPSAPVFVTATRLSSRPRQPATIYLRVLPPSPVAARG
jgi:hypothetical protein